MLLTVREPDRNSGGSVKRAGVSAVPAEARRDHSIEPRSQGDSPASRVDVVDAQATSRSGTGCGGQASRIVGLQRRRNPRLRTTRPCTCCTPARAIRWPIDRALRHDPQFAPGHCLRAALLVMAARDDARPALASIVQALHMLPGLESGARHHLEAAEAWLGHELQRSLALYGRIAA